MTSNYTDDDIARIKNLLINTKNSQIRKRIINECPEEILNKLRIGSGLFKSPVYAKGTKRFLAFNFTNISKKYWTRFSMTSIIAFLYKMLEEYTDDEDEELQQLVSENDPQFATIVNDCIKRAERSRPIEIFNEKLENLQVDNLTDPKKRVEFYSTQLKLLKHNQFYAEVDLEKQLEIFTKTEAILKKLEGCLTLAQHALDIAQYRKTLRQDYDKLSEDEQKKIYLQAENVSEVNYILDIDKIVLRQMDYTRKLENFDTEIQNKIIDIESFEQKIKDCEPIYKDAELKKDEAIALTKGYIDKIKEVKARFSKEFKGKAIDTIHETYTPTDDEYESYVQYAKQELGIEQTREEVLEARQDIIQRFLDTYLRYNPDLHVRCAYKPNYDDELRNVLIHAYENTPVDLTEYEDKVKQYRIVKEDEYEVSVIPPDDTFARLTRYQDEHYEELRQATDDIYCEKSDLEVIITPLEVFDDEYEADTWKRKYKDEFDLDVFISQFNVGSFVESWEPNRERRDIYNKDTEILKRIADKAHEDSTIGRGLMSKRVKKQKEKNEKENGPTDKGFSNYIKNNPNPLEKYGVVKADELVSASEGADMEHKEIGYTKISNKRRKGRRTFRPIVHQEHTLIDAENDLESVDLKPFLDYNPLAPDL